MYYKIYRIPVLNFIFRTAKAIPIAGQSEDKLLYESALSGIQAALEQGELVCLFPEGQITQDGEMSSFRPGILRMLEARAVPVVPVALQGLWGSLFSRKGGPAFFKLPRRIFARIGLVVGEPIPADAVTLDVLQQRVAELRGDRL